MRPEERGTVKAGPCPECESPITWVFGESKSIVDTEPDYFVEDYRCSNGKCELGQVKLSAGDVERLAAQFNRTN